MSNNLKNICTCNVMRIPILTVTTALHILAILGYSSLEHPIIGSIVHIFMLVVK